MLNPRSVFITGCSSGIGLELVRQLVHLPHPPRHLLASCLDPTNDEARQLRDVAAAHPEVVVVKLDIRSDQDIKQAVVTAEQVLGEDGLNLLINNAAILSKMSGVRDVTRVDLVDHFDCNTAGPMMVSKNFLPLLLKAANNSLSYLSCNRAAIINVSTGLSSVSFCVKNMKHPWYGYICSKAALTMATNIMGRELCNDGILVTAVNPGHVRTNMGGSDAPISVEDCIRKLLQTLASFNENSVGLLHSTNGDVIPL
ncbi:C-factor-like [Haliotis rufescens]|uniref:C-factor-like n=1 Tax=Haliotis rufescens TaxID=6454 RepID=UPI001EB00BDB|nr:C-factor-like [Haliotis rufescens]XP_046367537.1 C-factor-like [Haliotis rufescens]